MTLPLDLQTPAPDRALGSGAGDPSAPSSLPRSRVGDGTGSAEESNSFAERLPSGMPGTAGSTTTAEPVLQIHVVGVPAPQGSKRGFVVGKRAVIVDDNKPKLRSWREDVKHGAIAAMGEREGTSNPYSILGGPVELDVTFLLPRPRGHYRTGRNSHLLRDAAPMRPTTKPDVDKLLRSTLDALRDAGVYVDDAQVVNLTGRKHYATDRPGAVIQIYTTTGR